MTTHTPADVLGASGITALVQKAAARLVEHRPPLAQRRHELETSLIAEVWWSWIDWDEGSGRTLLDAVLAEMTPDKADEYMRLVLGYDWSSEMDMVSHCGSLSYCA